MHHTHDEMLNHYNHIVVGCFKESFQGMDTNNLPAVLQALKELNFILVNIAPGLSAHYGCPLEPWQISAEEVPDFISVYLNRPVANPPEHSSRGRPRTSGNHLYRPSRQSSPVPRYNYNDRNRQTNRSHTYPNFNRFCQEDRASYQSRYSDRDRHHLYSTPEHQHQYNQANNHAQHNTNNMSTLSTSDIIDSLQSQIIGLHSQPLQQTTLNSINMFDGTKKAEFATWAQSIENTVRICNLDAINIALSKLQGAPLKSAIYLEGKEMSTGKKLFLDYLKTTPNCQLLQNSL